MNRVRELVRSRWPVVRAVLVALHVIAVVVLTLPESTVADRSKWKRPNNQEDFASWARWLTARGFETTPAGLEEGLWRMTQSYLAVRRRVGAPFAPYASTLGVVQGWNMFASPQRFPGELHVDVLEGSAWRPLYRTRSREHAWRARQLDHTRMRKLVSNTIRLPQNHFTDLARWLATEAARDHPGAHQIRVRIYRWRALPPERVRAGDRPEGKFEQERTFDARTLR